jgi:hypothetical protein
MCSLTWRVIHTVCQPSCILGGSTLRKKMHRANRTISIECQETGQSVALRFSDIVSCPTAAAAVAGVASSAQDKTPDINCLHAHQYQHRRVSVNGMHIIVNERSGSTLPPNHAHPVASQATSRCHYINNMLDLSRLTNIDRSPSTTSRSRLYTSASITRSFHYRLYYHL